MDDFSDDGFDDLNDTVLQELENNAIQFTQAQQLAQSQAAPPAQNNAFEYEFDDDDLDDTVVIDEHALPPPRPPPQQTALPTQQPRHTTTGIQRWNHQLPSSRSAYPQRPQYAPPRPVPPPLPSRQRYPSGPSQRQPPASSARPQQGPQQSQFARPPLQAARPYAVPPSQAHHGAGPASQNEIIAALRARVSELESHLTASHGENSILRSARGKDRANFETEIARIKRETTEKLAEQERIAEQARAAERSTATELQFARQDLREGLGRAKSKRKDGPATPRKDRTWGMADGFDGIEVLSSPSKTQTLRRKDSGPSALPPGERTPTRGKRKRPIVDSPTFALETDGGDSVFDNARTVNTPALSSQLFPLDFLRLFLDHTAIHDQPPTFDVFSHYAFPADQKHSLASIILQRLPQMGTPGEPLTLLVEFADMLIEMWHQCLAQRYYGPIYHLVALIVYTLELNATEVASHIISALIPVCATTCRLVALPRLNSVDGDLSRHPDAVVRQLCLNIDVTHCLSLLYLAALACLPAPVQGSDTSDVPRPSPQLEFWRTMEFDFVLTMLSPKHPETDWWAMMSILRTSVTSDSIGPIPSSTTEPSSGRAETRNPRAVAATVIDCVSSFLCEPPRWAAHGSGKEILVRSAALETLTMFATSHFGALQIAESDVAIPRLVAVLCWAIDRLYDSDLPLQVEKQAGTRNFPGDRGDKMDVDQHAPVGTEAMVTDGAKSNAEALGVTNETTLDTITDPMSLLYDIISLATRLLHFIVTDPRTSMAANTSAKLAASHGGSQRYFLALARLNFAEEDLVMEAGIDAETVELAHELLELAVTPDEGEEISDMFD
ncbi:hypothetical protein CHGG_05247 [Chaetomium globosum CBS 148.51]|uniref:DNA repair protein Rad26 n=1 Tax=Chaetomium globosum (strain ATCC 6205 / CBS 148.51 / DSM 1962 / NBRC 6347 / NRRL 1970) TaxID=306901 RepID=Q2GYZ9_CHAGB|nr:uncharacterized protein CHGG_05247 [Chaetomium globosum CBS 148.51]EAQ88628.1 hypothetical protein CHGG_05247 [Chaetomium globosum CBS 148.51]